MDNSGMDRPTTERKPFRYRGRLEWRITGALYNYEMGDAQHGAALIPKRALHKDLKRATKLVFSGGVNSDDWEHVSVSHETLTPTWPTMCLVKALFWDDGDCVIQYHPPQSDYINVHEHCLHLWRPTGGGIARPGSWRVG